MDGVDSNHRCKTFTSAMWEQMWSLVFRSQNHLQVTRWKQDHNLILWNTPVGSVAIDALLVLTLAACQLCRISVSSGRLCVCVCVSSTLLLSYAALCWGCCMSSLTVICQEDVFHLQRKIAHSFNGVLLAWIQFTVEDILKLFSFLLSVTKTFIYYNNFCI